MLKFNKKCLNDNDFLTFQKISDIPFYQLYTYKDKDNFIYGFDICSIYNMLKNNEYTKNPYNRNELPTNTLRNIKKIIRLTKKLGYPLNIEIKSDTEELSDEKKLELEALNMVHEIDIEHLEAIMRTEMGSGVSKLSSKELKRDAYKFAKSNPTLFLELVEDEDIKLRNLANRAVEVGLLQLTDDNTVFKFPNGKKVLTVPFEQHPYGALAQYFKTDEGVDLMKSITKKLS